MDAVSTADFDKLVKQSDLPVIVDFWAEWCGPCKMLQPTLEKIAVENTGKIKIVKLNIDENQQTAADYGIRGIPTMLMFKDGNPVSSKTGVVPQSSIQAWIDQNV